MRIETLISSLNNNFSQVESENRTKIIKDENGVNRILIGKNPKGVYGVYISKPKKDVIKELEA